MVTHIEVFVVITLINLIACEWVEIPQTAVSDNDKVTKKSDITLYILTTTSTTTQTPVFVKPSVISRNANIDKISNSRVKNNIQTSMTTKRDFILPTASSKRVTTASTVVKPNIKNRGTNPSNREMQIQNKTFVANATKTINFAQKSELETIKNSTIKKQVAHDRLTDDDISNEDKEEIDIEYFVDDEEPTKPTASKPNTEASFSYSSFIPYLSAVQTTLMQNAHKNKRSKVNVLQNLRDHLLIEIENRITNLWNPKPKSRDAREYKDDSHVDFPSNEGALMTIGFLTFAVFLIKLVLHLIQTLSSQTDNGNGTTATAYLGGRKRRAIEDEDAVKILNYIEQFKLK